MGMEESLPIKEDYYLKEGKYINIYYQIKQGSRFKYWIKRKFLD